ncbi:MAG: carbonic anhydrase [Bacillota bacterium]
MFIRFALLFATFNLSACSYFQTRRSPNQDMKVVLKDAQGNTKEAPDKATMKGEKEAVAINPDEHGGNADAQIKAKEMREAVAAAVQRIQESHDKSQREVGPISADKSLGWLKNGNTRFTKGHLRADGASAKDRARLVSGQKPHAVILSCSDSYAPPEVVFDQKLGEVFVVRTAGESLDNNVIGSIEYAITHLGSNLIVVMGHESCDTVKETLTALKGADLGSPALNSLTSDLKPRLQQYASKQPSQGLLEESWANVNGINHDLIERSQILRDAVASGEVKIVGAMYHMESGNVEWQQK